MLDAQGLSVNRGQWQETVAQTSVCGIPLVSPDRQRQLRKTSQAEACATFARLPLFLVGVLDGLLRLGGLLIFLGEALDAAGRIDQLLLAGEEGVAVRADFHAQELALHRRSRGERVPAGAMHGDWMVVRMNIRLHGGNSPWAGRSARLPA